MKDNKELNKQKYDTDSIESLGVIGGVRNRPASIGLENHNHTFVEILANSIDEFREGFGDKIVAIKHEDGSISIQDFGRSVPMDINSKGEYAYNKVFNELWAGGKYNNNEDLDDSVANYLYSLGTNGCGATGTNYTSDFFEAIAYAPNGYKYFVRYEKGIQKTDLIKEKKDVDYTGTIIHWLPSAEVFRGKNIIDSQFVKETSNQQAIVNDSLTIEFIDKVNNTHETFYYKNGIIDFIKSIDKEVSFTDIVKWTTETKLIEVVEEQEVVGDKKEFVEKPFKFKANIVFAFNNEVNIMDYYHNSSYLKNGGSPEEYIKNGFTYAVDKYIKTKKLYEKNEKKVRFEDIKDSLIIISDTYSTISLYTDQAKKEMKSVAVEKYMTEYLKEKLEIYFTENTLETDKIIKQVLANKRSREQADKKRLAIKKKLGVNTKGGLSEKVQGLKQCNMRESTLEERILLIDEGVSANSTIIDSFDGRTMGAYGLKGRFINALKSSVSDVLDNIPARGIISALGCGIEIPKEEQKHLKGIDLFEIENLKYGSIGILCDADAFGKGIFLSLLTFFRKFLPTLLKQGRIYLVISPRYAIETKKGETIYVYNEEEKEQKIKELGSKNIHHIGIKKGLGEFDADEFWDYVLSPKVREKTFIKIEYDENNEEQISKHFDMLMGEDIENRKRFIRENIVDTDLNNVE